MHIVILSLIFASGLSGSALKVNTMHSPDSLIITIQDICWSPDASSIYFSAMRHKPDYSDYKPENWSAYRYDFNTKMVSVFKDSALYVSVSPSGNLIAVGKITDGNRDIFIYDKDGRNPRRLTSHPAEDFAAVFSPDEQHLIFNSKRDGTTELYSMQTDGTNLQRLTSVDTGEGSYNPQWSPDGNRIVYYETSTGGRDQIYVMDSDGTHTRNITNDTLLNYFPSWVNNNTILYTQDMRGGESKIFTISSDGRQRAPLMKIESYYARMSPDETMVAYVDRQDRCVKINAVNGDLIETICLQ